MVFTNDGAQFLAYRAGSPLNNLWIQQVAVGSGSGTATITDSTLLMYGLSVGKCFKFHLNFLE